MANRNSDGSGDSPPPPFTRRHNHAFDKICCILGARFEVPVHAVHLKSRFIEDLGIEAFDLPDLILALEEAFEIDISIGAATRILTVSDAVDCVLPEMKAKPALRWDE